jgi:assimilatory nitrate reductase catalytic subunit
MSFQRACGAVRFENDGQRAFDIGGWRISAVRRGTPGAGALAGQPQRRRSGFHAGWHRDGKLRMVPVTPPDPGATDAFYPLILNSGRIRDQWHTMTRTGACRV